MVISAVSTTGRLATRARGGRNPGRIVPAISRARFPHIVDARAVRGVQHDPRHAAGEGLPGDSGNSLSVGPSIRKRQKDFDEIGHGKPSSLD